MFEHLDDPNPSPPRQLLVELVVAEGARRRRRRAALAGGMAATLLVLVGGVRLSQMGGSEGSITVSEQPTVPSPDSRGEGGESGDEISTTPGSTTPGATTPASGPSNGEASAPPGTTTFAALTADGLVVLADTDLDGAISRVLVDAPDDGTQLGQQVALSPDRQTVYYVATPATGDEAGESAIFQVSTVTGDDPEVVATGSSPAISPDGTHLAYLHGSTQIVVRDLATDQEQSFTGAPAADDTVQDVAFTADSKALVFTAAPPDGPASLYYLDLSTVATIASLNDAAQLGPAGDAPAGTHWSTPDARATDHTIGVVASCCALDANSDASFAFVNPDTGLQPASVPVEGVSGTVLRASYDHSGQNQLVLTVDGGTYSLYQRQDGPLQRLDQAAQYTAVDW